MRMLEIVRAARADSWSEMMHLRTRLQIAAIEDVHAGWDAALEISVIRSLDVWVPPHQHFDFKSLANIDDATMMTLRVLGDEANEITGSSPFAMVVECECRRRAKEISRWIARTAWDPFEEAPSRLAITLWDLAGKESPFDERDATWVKP